MSVDAPHTTGHLSFIDEAVDVTADHRVATMAPATAPYAYIRRFYGVDPQIGQRIEHYGRAGVIVRPQGDPHYLRVRFDGQQHASNVHPTDDVKYG